MAAQGRQIYLSPKEIEFLHGVLVEKEMGIADDHLYYEEFEPEVPKLVERLKKKMWYYG